MSSVCGLQCYADISSLAFALPNSKSLRCLQSPCMRFMHFFNPKSEVTELTSERNSSQSVARQPPEAVGHFTSVFEHMKAGSKTWRKLSSSVARNRVPGKDRKVGPPADWGAIITDNPHMWGPGLWKVSEPRREVGPLSDKIGDVSLHTSNPSSEWLWFSHHI